MATVKFTPLVPLMAQVAETHFDAHNFLQTNLQYYIYFPNRNLILLEEVNVFLPLVPD